MKKKGKILKYFWINAKLFIHKIFYQKKIFDFEILLYFILFSIFIQKMLPEKCYPKIIVYKISFMFFKASQSSSDKIF